MELSQIKEIVAKKRYKFIEEIIQINNMIFEFTIPRKFLSGRASRSGVITSQRQLESFARYLRLHHGVTAIFSHPVDKLSPNIRSAINDLIITQFQFEPQQVVATVLQDGKWLITIELSNEKVKPNDIIAIKERLSLLLEALGARGAIHVFNSNTDTVSGVQVLRIIKIFAPCDLQKLTDELAVHHKIVPDRTIVKRRIESLLKAKLIVWIGHDSYCLTLKGLRNLGSKRTGEKKESIDTLRALALGRRFRYDKRMGGLP